MADVFTAQGGRVHRAATRDSRSSSTSRRTTSTCRACRTRASPAQTAMGPRGDAIAQLDWCVGEILATLDRLEARRQHARHLHQRQRPGRRRRLPGRRGREAGRPQARRPVPRRQVQQLRRRHARAVHRPLAGAREAGGVRRAGLPGRSARVVRRARRARRWPIRARADSENVLPALLGTSQDRADRPGRAGRIAVAQARTLEVHRARARDRESTQNTNTELGNDPEPQLYDLAADPGERNNLAAANPEKVRELAALLEGIRRPVRTARRPRRPNIVLAIADDWSFPHAGIYGDRDRQHAEFRSCRARRGRGSRTPSSRRRRARRHARRF